MSSASAHGQEAVLDVIGEHELDRNAIRSRGGKISNASW